MKWNQSIRLSDALFTGLTVCIVFCYRRVEAQSVQSVDLGPLIKALANTVTEAEAHQKMAQSKCQDLCGAAELFEAQARNTATPPQGRASAQVTALDLRIEAAGLQLDAARQTAELLTSARRALNEICTAIGETHPTEQELSTPKSQAHVDTVIANFDFDEGAEIDACSAQVLRSARDFYSVTSTFDTRSRNWTTALRLVARNLSTWEAKNRQTIVLADTTVRRLELTKAQVVSLTGAGVPTQPSGHPNSFKVDSALLSTSLPAKINPPVTYGIPPYPLQASPQYPGLSAQTSRSFTYQFAPTRRQIAPRRQYFPSLSQPNTTCIYRPSLPRETPIPFPPAVAYGANPCFVSYGIMGQFGGQRVFIMQFPIGPPFPVRLNRASFRR